jgi:hypothetical protein
MPVQNLLRYLLLPARPTVLFLIVALSLGCALALNGGLLGIPIGVMLLLALCSYSQVLLERIANGAPEPPVLSIEMLHPLSEHRPLLPLAIVLGMGGALRLVAYTLGTPVAVLFGIIAGCALPAALGALAVGSSAVQAIDPRVLWQIARALGTAYVGILAAALLEAAGLWLLSSRQLLPHWLLVPLLLFGWLSVFALIGGSLYERRDELGHDALDSPERRAARVLALRDHERQRVVDRIYGQARGGNLAGAWHSLERELALHQHAFEYYDWMLDRLGGLQQPGLAQRLAQDYVSRALARDNARVTRLVQRVLAVDPTFRPRSGAETLRVAELASLSGDRRTARTLLLDFPQRFPGDAGVASAAALAGRLAAD